MTPKHKQAIKQRYSEAMALKLDTDQYEALRAIRRRAIELGYAHDQVTEVFREVRNDNTDTKQYGANVAVPAEELPPAQEKPKEVQPKLPEEVLSQRVAASYITPSGMTNSGVRKSGASGGKSIVDGIL